MKKSILILTGAFLFTICFQFQSLSAQETTVTLTEKEKEQKLQQAIDLQKKAMADQKKAQEMQSKEIEKAMQEAEINIAKVTEPVNRYGGRVRSTGNGGSGFDEMVFTPGVSWSGYSDFGRRGDSERTTWDFSKQVKETTFARDYSFDVEKTASTVVMTVMGDCKSGQIRVKIVMPGGKVYSDIVIDEFGNLNWRKSFTISEEENKDKAGEWKFRIEAEKATGFFKISLQTY
jgi:hypothetical protein